MAFLRSDLPIPENLLKLMRPEDRRALGRGAMTREEAIGKIEAKDEATLQKQLLALVSGQRGIHVIYQRMDKPTRTKRGTPDLMFAVGCPREWEGEKWTETVACAWEVKTLTGERSPAQIEMERVLTTAPNAWRYRVIRSYDEALRELRDMLALE